jgi:hypothetical protein
MFMIVVSGVIRSARLCAHQRSQAVVQARAFVPASR